MTVFKSTACNQKISAVVLVDTTGLLSVVQTAEKNLLVLFSVCESGPEPPLIALDAVGI